jgi:hypothetical protein
VHPRVLPALVTLAHPFPVLLLLLLLMKEYLYPPTASDYLPSSSLHLGKHTQSKHLAELTERVYYTVNAMKV